MQVASVSFAYPHADGDIRAALTRRLRPAPLPPDTFVLSTCLRIEVAVAGSLDDLERAVLTAFGQPPALAEGVVRLGETAVAHLFRVAAGLNSPILGEREVLTQFRQAVARAEECSGGTLLRVLEAAVSVGRQARELLPGSPHDSMAAVAAQLAGNASRVGVLGSGTMAKAVVSALRGLPSPPAVVVAARHPEKARLAGAEVWSFDRAPDMLATFPLVISATSAGGGLIPDRELEEALARRTSRLTLVDMAMPPDFPSGAAVTLVDIDELARMADRRPRRDDADAMVAAAAAEVWRRLATHHALGPVIGGLMQSADDIVDRTVERFARRLGNGNDRGVLRQAAHTAVRTLLSGPVSYLQAADRPSEVVDTIAAAFGLDDG
jgi:glutamyl-tRNA reductase